MARMTPDINPVCIANDGERRFYQAAQELPYLPFAIPIVTSKVMVSRSFSGRSNL